MKIINVTILLFTIHILLIFGYNLDTKNPLILKYKNSSYFGYSIILDKSVMIIGAPKDNYSVVGGSSVRPVEPGAVWKYVLKTGEWQQFTPGVTDDTGFIKDRSLTTLIMKKNGWFGASIAIQDDNDVLTVCAPRTSISLIVTILREQYKSNTMHGMCYTGKISTGELQIEDPNLSSYDFSVSLWFHPLRGFSVHYPSSLPSQDKNDNRMIMGSPKHGFVGSVRIDNQSNSVFLSYTDDVTQFGYAVSSGRFFDKNKLLYVGGGPGKNVVGQVAIIDPSVDPAIIISRLNGNNMGEYFGASLAVCDMNHDGLDDLIIGAPYWGNDNGRVYIYLGDAKGFSKSNIVLDGLLDDGLFGYAVTCGDLDADGFDDLIVGAPYGGDGMVYIYNGDSIISQEIEKNVQKVSVNSRIKTFGFSLSKPVDIDENGFPDLAVGAYKSGHAIILKSRPVIKTHFHVSTVPISLSQNSTNFLVKICVQHTERGLSRIQSFDLTLNVDKQFKRVNKSQIVLEYIPNWNMSIITEVCLNTTFYILENFEKNFFDPIDILVTHTFSRMKRLKNNETVECELCPIESKGVSSKIRQLALPFDLNCGSDKICTAILKLHANFDRNQSAWIIGSEDITYEVFISNHGEPAYSTEIIVELPRGIYLRSYLPSCDKYGDDSGILKIKCHVDEPLIINDTKKIAFILDMSRLNDGDLNGTYLNFIVSVKARSLNNGTYNISTPLLLLSHIVTVIEGTAKDEKYHYFLNDEATSNINFQHSYEVLKSGATPINKATLNVDVPTKFGDLEIIILTEVPNVRISGTTYECSVINIPGLDKEDIIPINLENFTKEHLRMTRNIKELPQKISSIYKTELENVTDYQVINLNCSSHNNISCGKIICDIPLLQNKKDSVVLQLKFSVDLKLLMDNIKYEEKKYIVSFTTQAWIEIIKPSLGPRKIAKVSTKFRQIEKLNRMYMWIIVGSVLLGLLVLFIIIIILWAMGFFRRDKKNVMESLKTNENTANLAESKDTKL
ncbi:hypothetical protein PV328_010979 [Microctonus aethiopoides]|uniref:Uncharacterized protein n=1 Tax=Microctonus aethiopoides TaxID=144406 RepID=A0AA39KR22_9HYME|nr:hypothetical protein PV328_010979 [Microctonus aethiopoides]